MTRTRRIVNREFKLNVVELSYTRQNIKELAFEYELRPQLIYRWRSEFATLEGASLPCNGNKKMSEEESEILIVEVKIRTRSLQNID